jgi:hypothetical protein
LSRATTQEADLLVVQCPGTLCDSTRSVIRRIGVAADEVVGSEVNNNL